MNFALLSRPRTQALLDGKLKLDLPIRWDSIPDPLGWALPAAEKDRSILTGRFVGGEMSISSFIRAKSQGAPLLALPVFLKRGLVQRSLFCSSHSPFTSPEQLKGKRVGWVNYHSSMAVWMRGILAEEYRLSRSSPIGFSLTPSPRTNLVEIPEDFVADEIEAWEELDGYAHKLDRRECLLISLLEKGELDAVVSFQARIASDKIRPLVPKDELWSHYEKKLVYPINHLFVMHDELFSQLPGIGKVLLSNLKEARKLWVDYLAGEKRGAIEKEIDRLRWDPFAYRLGEVEKRTLETFIEYLLQEQMISQKLIVSELFYRDLIEDRA